MYTHEIIFTICIAIIISIVFNWIDSKRFKREFENANRQIQQQKANKYINRV